MNRWRLVDTGFESASFNMSLDELFFQEALEKPDFVPTLRVYGFRRPAMTYGYLTKVSSHWLEDPLYESARRITGGGLVFHGKDLTYSFVGPCRISEKFGALRESYRTFHEVVRRAFRRLAIEVAFFSGRPREKSLRSLCFLDPVRDDLLFQGKKVAGSAQKRSRGVFLHQGTVNFRVFLEEDGSYLPFFETFKQAFLDAFQEYLQVEFVVQSNQDHAGSSSSSSETPSRYREEFQISA